MEEEENIAIASGEAKAVQGNRILNAEKIIVFFNKKEDKKIFTSLMPLEMLDLLVVAK